MEWIGHQGCGAKSRSRWPPTIPLMLMIYFLGSCQISQSAMAGDLSTVTDDPALWPPIEGNTNEVILKEEAKTDTRRSVNDEEDLMVVQPRLSFDNLMRSDIMASASLPSFHTRKSHKVSKKSIKKVKGVHSDATRDELDSILGAIQVAHHHRLTRNDIRRLAKKAFEMDEKKHHDKNSRKFKIHKGKKPAQKMDISEDIIASKKEALNMKNNFEPMLQDISAADSQENPGTDIIHLNKGNAHSQKTSTSTKSSDNFKFSKGGDDLFAAEPFENPALQVKKTTEVDSDMQNIKSNQTKVESTKSSSETSKVPASAENDIGLQNNGNVKDEGDLAPLPLQKNVTIQKQIESEAEQSKTPKRLSSMFSDEAMGGDTKGGQHKGKHKGAKGHSKDKTEAEMSPSNISAESLVSESSKQASTASTSLSQLNSTLTPTEQNVKTIELKSESATSEQNNNQGNLLPDHPMESTLETSTAVSKSPAEAIPVKQKKELKKTNKKSKKKKSSLKVAKLTKKSEVPSPEKRDKIRTLETLLSKANPRKIPKKFLPDFPSGLRMIAWRELLKKKNLELQDLKRGSADQAEAQASDSSMKRTNTAAGNEEKPVEVNIEIGGDASAAESDTASTNEIKDNSSNEPTSKEKKTLVEAGTVTNSAKQAQVPAEASATEKKQDIAKEAISDDNEADNITTISHVDYLKRHLDEAQSLRKLIAKALVNHCQATGKRILQAFIAMDKALSRAQAIATIIGKKFHVNPDRIDNLVGEKENEVVETFLRDIFSKFS